MTLRYKMLAATVIAVLGVLAVIAAVIYFTTAGKSLPSILGQLPGYAGHRSKRGIAALVVGIVLLIAAGGLALYRPRPRP
jgi:amino acid permease